MSTGCTFSTGAGAPILHEATSSPGHNNSCTVSFVHQTHIVVLTPLLLGRRDGRRGVGPPPARTGSGERPGMRGPRICPAASLSFEICPPGCSARPRAAAPVLGGISNEACGSAVLAMPVVGYRGEY